MTTKAANYTDKQVKDMQTAYEKATDAETRKKVVTDIAAKYGKSTRSIISKMSREGFYIKKPVVSTVTGEKPANKEQLAITLRIVSDLPMVSAEKMNKTDIQDLINFFTRYNADLAAEFDNDPELSGGKES
jgi:hypothetical protein